MIHLDTLKAMREERERWLRNVAATGRKFESEPIWTAERAALDAVIAAMERLARVRAGVERRRDALLADGVLADKYEHNAGLRASIRERYDEIAAVLALLEEP